MLIIEKSLFCDKCGTLFGQLYHLTGHFQRMMAKADGWKYINDKDYCPECKLEKYGDSSSDRKNKRIKTT